MTRPSCRISKVTYKDGRAPLSVMVSRERMPGFNGTNNDFIETMVSMLRTARMGKVSGFAIAFLHEQDNGQVKAIHCADIDDLNGPDYIALLGAIEEMKSRYMSRIREARDDAR